MNVKNIHICPSGSGGISDYIEILMAHQRNAKKLHINQEAGNITLSGDIVLHFSGYGYARRGTPWWLLKMLKKERKNIASLGVFFHELYAFGYPWSSAFWLSPAQRYITMQIAKLADYWMTNREGSAHWIRRFAADRPHTVLPVFSNVGELTTYSPLRSAKVVIFGGAALRLKTYQAAGDKFFAWINRLGLELHDIGPSIQHSQIQRSLSRAGAVIHGLLEKNEVSLIMQNARFGLINYPHDYLTKSGVFAAYCSHGVCPIVIGTPQTSQNGLRAGMHFLTDYPLPTQPDDDRSIARSAFSWYQQHTIQKQVEIIKNLHWKG